MRKFVLFVHWRGEHYAKNADRWIFDRQLEKDGTDALERSMLLIHQIEAHTPALSGRSVSSLLTAYRSAYERHLAFLLAQLDVVRRGQPEGWAACAGTGDTAIPYFPLGIQPRLSRMQNGILQ